MLCCDICRKQCDCPDAGKPLRPGESHERCFLRDHMIELPGEDNAQETFAASEGGRRSSGIDQEVRDKLAAAHTHLAHIKDTLEILAADI